jgi:hypothetical protein|tara:strand:- start:98 stop:286 length:189 start_codon:yes stop_codon:yes gene_type:complete
MTNDEVKFKEFCLKMYHANNKERKAYGEKQYDNFKMYYKFNEKFLRDYYYDKEMLFSKKEIK